jgi:ABC-2 type transport system permease protein
VSDATATVGAGAATLVHHEPNVVAMSWAMARRSLANTLRIPAAMIPILAMPLFFLISFTGTFNGIGRLLPTDNIYSWFAPFALLQGAAFAGFATGFGTVRDIETGFYDRLLLSPGSRFALFLGPIMAGIVRATFTYAIVTGLGFALGAELPGGPLGLVTLWVAAVGMATIATGWALGVVYRIPGPQSGPLLQVGIFFTTFLSTGQVPISQQIGWVKHLARFNPLTNVLELARQGLIGDVTWRTTWPGLVALTLSTAVLWTFAATGIRRLTA